MSNQTDTPRTDAFLHAEGKGPAALRRHAQELERENSQLRKEFATFLEAQARMLRRSAVILESAASGELTTERALLALSSAITENDEHTV